MHYTNYKSKDMILRDHLAYDRTILALERTVLAYLRTAISLLAAGITLLFLYADHRVCLISAWVLIIGGIISAVYGIIRGKLTYSRLKQIYTDRNN